MNQSNENLNAPPEQVLTEFCAIQALFMVEAVLLVIPRVKYPLAEPRLASMLLHLFATAFRLKLQLHAAGPTAYGAGGIFQFVVLLVNFCWGVEIHQERIEFYELPTWEFVFTSKLPLESAVGDGPAHDVAGTGAGGSLYPAASGVGVSISTFLMIIDPDHPRLQANDIENLRDK